MAQPLTLCAESHRKENQVLADLIVALQIENAFA
jgi:hypothetical protein